MTEEEYLHDLLIEEACEVQHRASKLMRFGPGETQRGHNLPNSERLINEVMDLMSIVAILQSRGYMRQFLADELSEHHRLKKDKVNHYMRYSHNLGRLV